MARVTNWEIVLDRHIAAGRAKEFNWGSHDCCTFACDGAFLLTGIDPMSSLRGKYKDAIGAARLLARHDGLEQTAQWLGSNAGFEQRPVAMAQRGDIVLDIVLTEHGLMPALGMVGLDGMKAHFAAPYGLTDRMVLGCRSSWRVD